MYECIINPNAQSGQGRRIWEEMEKELKRKSCAFRAFFTEGPGHATALARQITADGGPHTLLVLGGDGTVNEVLSGICVPPQTTLGYVPAGSSNDFARGLGLPQNPRKALEIVLKSEKLRGVDAGILRCPGTSRRFAVSSGIGYDAAICHQVSVSRLKKLLNRLHLGKLAYVGVSLDRLVRCRPGKMKLQLDDSRNLSFRKAYFATAMNLPCEGGGCYFCPDASPSDGLLDVIVVADIPKWRALILLPLVFSGAHKNCRGVHIYRCRKVRIQSEKPLPVHADGEPVAPCHQVEMELEKNGISVIVSDNS
ncbi:MAG TPA: diacylglycerol kinase family lipid kinase [Candidatus Bariatricus faecipullorum]|nr:diacylglycerol kinase family lipid kinase [Candidatus Bariatricus faecipullorum]